MAKARKKVLLLGGTGTIGRACAKALVDAGYSLTCFVRPDYQDAAKRPLELVGADLRFGVVTDPESLRSIGFAGEQFDTLISCLASRDGNPDDAWAIDDAANRTAFELAKEHGVTKIVLLSAICVQKPRLAFQQAKLSAENALVALGVDYSIIRPTAFFKSLSGQIDRVRHGKPFLVFGDGRLTACKPISDSDLAAFVINCIDNPKARNKIMPIGGPGPAITPNHQASALFQLIGRPEKVRRLPIWMMATIAAALGGLSRIFPSLLSKAEFAKIGHYYATESMLVWDEESQSYSEPATPSFGTDTLFDYYAQVLRGEESVEKGDHSVF